MWCKTIYTLSNDRETYVYLLLLQVDDLELYNDSYNYYTSGYTTFIGVQIAPQQQQNLHDYYFIHRQAVLLLSGKHDLHIFYYAYIFLGREERCARRSQRSFSSVHQYFAGSHRSVDDNCIIMFDTEKASDPRQQSSTMSTVVSYCLWDRRGMWTNENITSGGERHDDRRTTAEPGRGNRRANA